MFLREVYCTDCLQLLTRYIVCRQCASMDYLVSTVTRNVTVTTRERIAINGMANVYLAALNTLQETLVKVMV